MIKTHFFLSHLQIWQSRACVTIPHHQGCRQQTPGNTTSQGQCLMVQVASQVCAIVSALQAAGEGNGNPLQCSYLENPMDRGTWQATVHGVAQCQTKVTQHIQAAGKRKEEKVNAQSLSRRLYSILLTLFGKKLDTWPYLAISEATKQSFSCIATSNEIYCSKGRGGSC